MGEARSVVEGFYDAFNRGDLEATRRFVSDDVENVDPTGVIRGWEGFRQYIGGFKAAIPDAQLHARTWIESGDMAVVEGMFTGTFTNPLTAPAGDIQPTGKSFELPYAEINQVRNGRIVSHRDYYDQMTFLAVLGVTPEQSEPAQRR
jgi:ketosteroid isomerase-like protein